MRITGVIKTSYISQGHSFAANKGLTIKVPRVITGAIVVEFQDPEESDTLEKVYSWFQETSGTGKAPFPEGTLLSYSVHDKPAEEQKKPQASSESELLLAVKRVLESYTGPWHNWTTTNQKDLLIDYYLVEKEAFEKLIKIYKAE